MRSLVLLAGYAAAAVRDADPLVKTPVSQDRDATKDIVLQTERPVPLDAKGCCVPSHDVSSAGNVGRHRSLATSPLLQVYSIYSSLKFSILRQY
jgi:hypothetical protein